MSDRNILFVYKKSNLDYHFRDSDSRKKIFAQEQTLIYRDLVYGHRCHEDALNRIRDVFDKLHCKVTILLRELAFVEEEYALVISAGGDGTLFEVATMIRSTPIFGINTCPDLSVGNYCCCSVDTLEKTLGAVLSGGSSPKAFQRLAIWINGTKHSLRALNDVLFAHQSPVGMVSFYMKDGSQWNLVKSSGIWVSTPTGSSAAIFSAGGTKQSADDPRFQYFIREPYLIPPRQQGFLEEEGKLTILCKCFHAALFVDGRREPLGLKLGDMIEIGFDDSPLYLYHPVYSSPTVNEKPRNADK